MACDVLSALRDAFQASFRRGGRVAVSPNQLETVCERECIVHEHFVSADLNTASTNDTVQHTPSADRARRVRVVVGLLLQ